MPKIVRYDEKTRDLFDSRAQEILDLVRAKYPIVEVEYPEKSSSEQLFFVQVYRKGEDNMPEGFFGESTYEAACRVAKALKIPT